jgi:hypothetical protein
VSEPVAESTGPDATGDERVDRVLASLDTLDGLPVTEHVAVFEQAHRALQEALADAGTEGAGTPTGTPTGPGA